MKKGDKVILTAGPYSGYEGEIICEAPNNEYKVAVSGVGIIQIKEQYLKMR